VSSDARPAAPSKQAVTEWPWLSNAREIEATMFSSSSTRVIFAIRDSSTELVGIEVDAHGARKSTSVAAERPREGLRRPSGGLRWPAVPEKQDALKPNRSRCRPATCGKLEPWDGSVAGSLRALRPAHAERVVEAGDGQREPRAGGRR